MNDNRDSGHLANHDRDVLEQIDALVADPSGLRSSADSTVQLGVELARSAPRAEATFQRQLHQRLLAEHARLHPTRSGVAAATRLRRNPTDRLRLAALGVAAAIALILLALGVAVGQGRLAHVVPIEVATPPSFPSPGSGHVSYPTNVATDGELQALLPFPLLVPTELPAGCPGPYRRAYNAENQEATLVYRCVSITERRGDRVISPLANPGTVEDVLVNGKPALYFDEAVVQTPVWTPIAATPTVDKLAPAIPGSTIDGGAARMPTLIFERDGVIVWISAFSYQQPAQVPLPTKADLIRVAESMRPLAERGTQ